MTPAPAPRLLAAVAVGGALGAVGRWALGEAFQMSNFIRDVGEDLQRGRVYLPEEDLELFGVTREILQRRVHARVEPCAGAAFETRGRRGAGREAARGREHAAACPGGGRIVHARRLPRSFVGGGIRRAVSTPPFRAS